MTSSLLQTSVLAPVAAAQEWTAAPVLSRLSFNPRVFVELSETHARPKMIYDRSLISAGRFGLSPAYWTLQKPYVTELSLGPEARPASLPRYERLSERSSCSSPDLKQTVFKGIREMIVQRSQASIRRHSSAIARDTDQAFFTQKLFINLETGQVSKHDPGKSGDHIIPVMFIVEPDAGVARIVTQSQGEIFRRLRQITNAEQGAVLKNLLVYAERPFEFKLLAGDLQELLIQNREMLPKLHAAVMTLNMTPAIATLVGSTVVEGLLFLDEQGLIIGSDVSRPVLDSVHIKGTHYKNGLPEKGTPVFARFGPRGELLEIGETHELSPVQREVIEALYNDPPSRERRENFLKNYPYALEVLNRTEAGELYYLMADLCRPYIDKPQTILVVKTPEGKRSLYALDHKYAQDLDRAPLNVEGHIRLDMELDENNLPVMSWQVSDELAGDEELKTYMAWLVAHYEWFLFTREDSPREFILSKNYGLFRELNRFLTRDREYPEVFYHLGRSRGGFLRVLRSTESAERYSVGTVVVSRDGEKIRCGISHRLPERETIIAFLTWILNRL